MYRGINFIRRMTSRIQAAYLSGVQIDLVFPGSPPEILHSMPCIALCDAVMLSEEEVEKLSDYLTAGGRMIVEGVCGALNADGTKRGYDAVGRLSSFGDVRVVPEHEGLTQDGVSIGRYENMVPFKNAPANHIAALKNLAGQTIRPHLKTRRVSVQTEANVIPAFFTVVGGYVVHLLNYDNLIPQEGTPVTRCWKYPHYEAGVSPIDTPSHFASNAQPQHHCGHTFFPGMGW